MPAGSHGAACTSLTMSNTPKGLAPQGWASTSSGPRKTRPVSCTGTQSGWNAWPHGYWCPVLPCAAYCHSHSCGSRPPAQWHAARASLKDTQVTGLLPQPGGYVALLPGVVVLVQSLT